MNANHTRTRREDQPVYRWLPAISIIAASGIAWGVNTSQVNHLRVSADELRLEVRRLRDAGIRTEGELARFNERLAESQVAARLVADLAESLGAVRSDVQRNWQNVDALWPMLRAGQANVQILAEELRRMGRSITLQQPAIK